MWIHCLAAFLSGVILEALYAVGVAAISRHKTLVGVATSIMWGVGVLVGVNESFKSLLAACLWCLGLGLGTWIGMKVNTTIE